MKNLNKYIAGLMIIGSLFLGSCGSTGSSSGGSIRSVNHYHHGSNAWGRPYYGDDVIIIDEDIDIGMPDGGAVNLPADDWDY